MWVSIENANDILEKITQAEDLLKQLRDVMWNMPKGVELKITGSPTAIDDPDGSK